MIKLILIAGLFLTSITYAEYRVYQYSVTNLNKLNNQSTPQIAISTLDPVSYVAYHGGSQAIKIDLLDSWMCRGNTGRNKYCRSPYHMTTDSVEESL